MQEKEIILQDILIEFGFNEFSSEPSEHKRKLKKQKFLFNVYFPNNNCTIYFYEEEINPETLMIEFISQPKWVKSVRIPFTEIKSFVQQMMLPGLQLQPLSVTAWASYSRERTEALLQVDNEKVKTGLFYLGLDDPSVYSDIYHRFIVNPFLSAVCVNEAGKEGSAWGAAQFRTAYSGSFLNYEGIEHGNTKEKMLFYLSYSYLPNEFGIQYLFDSTLQRPKHHYPEDMPIDLVLAIDSLNYTSQVSVEDMLQHIENDGEEAVFYTYVLLLSRGIPSFFNQLPRILKNKNPAVLEYLNNYFDWIEDIELKLMFEKKKRECCEN